MRSIKLIIAATLVISPFAASAGVIVDNGFSDSSLNGISWNNNTTQWRTWDNFYLDSDTTLTSGSWKQNSHSLPSLYYLDIVTDNIGSLGTSVFSTTLGSGAVGLTSLGSNRYQFDFNLAGLNLGSGAYWISLSGSYLYGSTYGGDGIIQVGACCGPFQRGGVYIPFQLNGVTHDVPEPGTLMLLGLGLAGMGLARHRKKV